MPNLKDKHQRLIWSAFKTCISGFNIIRRYILHITKLDFSTKFQYLFFMKLYKFWSPKPKFLTKNGDVRAIGLPAQ